MIHLTVPHLTADMFPDADGTPATLDYVEGLIDVISEFRKMVALKKGHIFPGTNGVDLDNPTRVYSKFAFKVGARFDLDGDLWLAGEGFAVNYDSMMNSLNALHRDLSRAANA